MLSLKEFLLLIFAGNNKIFQAMVFDRKLTLANKGGENYGYYYKSGGLHKEYMF